MGNELRRKGRPRRTLQRLRSHYRMTQAEMAEHLRCSGTYLSQVEAGARQPSVRFWLTLASRFRRGLLETDTDLEDLMRGKRWTRREPSVRKRPT